MFVLQPHIKSGACMATGLLTGDVSFISPTVSTEMIKQAGKPLSLSKRPSLPINPLTSK